MRSSGSVTHLVDSVGRRRGVHLDGHGLDARIALGAVPDEPAHDSTLPAVTTATHPARSAVGSSGPTARPRAGSSTRRQCSECPLGAARAGRRHRLGRGRSSGRRCRPARGATGRGREAQSALGGLARHRTVPVPAAPRTGASGSVGAGSSPLLLLTLVFPRRERTSGI